MLIYIIIAVITILIDIAVAVKSFCRRNKTGKYLGITASFAAAVALIYSVSIFVEDYFLYSVLSSTYFFCIDLMLLSGVACASCLTNVDEDIKKTLLLKILSIFTAFEFIVFAVNPFAEIAIGYIPNGRTSLAVYSYDMKALYIVHLVFTYLLAAIFLILLLKRILSVPVEYRHQCRIIALGVFLLLALNGLYLYAPKSNLFTYIDVSVYGYFIILLLLYYSCFLYSETSMRHRFEAYVFETMHRGIIMFDIDDKLIVRNKRADVILPDAELYDGKKLDEFIAETGLLTRNEMEQRHFSKQVFINYDGKERTIRCDNSIIYNAFGKELGKIIVLTDNDIVENDLLTGFTKYESFLVAANKDEFLPMGDYGAVVFDIVDLAEINTEKSYSEGDHRISELAASIRNAFPDDCLFIREQAANLVVICPNMAKDAICLRADRIVADYDDILYACALGSEIKGPDVNRLIDTANEALINKKLLDSRSKVSDSIASTLRALQQCDIDTQAHVVRTRVLGEALGKRLGLSDLMQSRLALLCLLHDVGKIGIPTEIIKKPSGLSESEWKLMRTHVDKGSKIVSGIDATAPIADAVLHHHERWDGKGYPDRLRGEEIPLLSRIIAVIDTYDAMTNDRPYNPAVSNERACIEIERCAGSQYDPEIVSTFFALLKEEPELVSRVKAITDPEEKSGSAAAGDVPIPASTDIVQIFYSRYTIDRSMNIVEADDNFEIITGYSKQDLEDLNLSQIDLLPPENRGEYSSIVAALIGRDSMACLDHPLLRKDGSVIRILCYGQDYYDSSSESYKADIIVYPSKYPVDYEALVKADTPTKP